MQNICSAAAVLHQELIPNKRWTSSIHVHFKIHAQDRKQNLLWLRCHIHKKTFPVSPQIDCQLQTKDAIQKQGFSTVVQFVTRWHIITENSENAANLVWSTISIASKNQCCCDTLQFFHVHIAPGSKVFSSICYSLNAILSLDKFHKFLKPQ